ncbi:hypothetical protein D9M68_909700 [compost metagenome]
MVELVRENDAVGQQPADRGNGRLVGNEARGKDEGGLLAVQVGQRTLQLDQRAVGARNIAGAARADAETAGGFLHGADHLGVLAHAEIIVGTPDGDFALIVGIVAIDRAREAPGDALDIGEHAITLFRPQ